MNADLKTEEGRMERITKDGAIKTNETQRETQTQTVRLTDGTIGTIDIDTLNGQSAADFIGEVVRVKIYDENGNLEEASGTLAEVLHT